MNDTASAVRLPDAVGSRAVLIGVGHYESDGLEDLPSVSRGAKALHTLLTDPRTGSFAPDRCTLVEDPQDQAALAQPLLAAATAATDVFLVYHCGHGLIAGQERELYLALSGTDPSMAEWTGLPYRLIREAFRRTPARARVLILDSCHSGMAISGVLAETETSLIGQVDIDGTYVMTSVPALALAQAPVGDDYTSFTGALLNILERGIPGGPDLLSLDAVFNELHRLFGSLGLPLPQQASEQTAAMVALARNAGGRPPAAGPRPEPELPPVEGVLAAIRERAEAADTQGAVRIAREAASRRTVRLGADHPETLQLRASMVYWLGYGTEQDVKTSIPLARGVLADRARVLGAEHEQTQKSRTTLASNLFMDQQDDEAFALLAEVSDICARVLGPEDVETIRAEETIAYFKGRAGAHAEAAAILRGLVPRYAAATGPRSEHSLRVLGSLASNTGNAGDASAAMDLYRQSAELAAQIHGAEARRTLIERSSHVEWTGKAGKQEEALQLARELLPVMERVLGPQDAETQEVRHQYAAYLLNTGSAAKSVEQFRAVCSADEERLGRTNPATFAARRNLATALSACERTEEAAGVLQQLLDDIRQTDGFGPEHPQALACMRQLADWAGGLGHPSRALRMYREIVEIESRVLPRDDLDALQSRLNLAFYTGATNDYPAAVALYTEAVDDTAWLLGRDSRVALSVRGSLAVMIAEMGDPVRATNLLHQLEADQTRILGEHDQDTSRTRLQIARYRFALPKGPYAPPLPGWLPPAN